MCQSPGPCLPVYQHCVQVTASVGLGFHVGRGCVEENVPFQVTLLYIVASANPTLFLSPLAPIPSALQVLCVFMKFRAQLHRWPPFVLLQSCEQVPKRRHSLMSGGYPAGSRAGLRLGALPAPLPSAPPPYPGIRAGQAQCGSLGGRHSRRPSQCACSEPRHRRCWRWWHSWSAWGLCGRAGPSPEPR